MSPSPSITLSEDRAQLLCAGQRLALRLPAGAEVCPITGGMKITGGESADTLRLSLDERPTGTLTLETASWLAGRWCDLSAGEPQSVPTPAVLTWPGGALAVGIEGQWVALDLTVAADAREVELPLPAKGRGAIWLMAGDLHGALTALAEAMMAEVSSPPARGPLLGWMSWDELRFDLSERDVVENAEVVARRLATSEAIMLLDDGWQRTAGDWEPNERFSHGMRWLTDQIHRTGLRAGLWVAPFLVALRSPLGCERRDWLLRGDDGEPLVELDQPHWGGAVGTLDPTRPEVRVWLRDLGAKIAGWGFDYLKMDFLFHALTGHAAEKSPPRGEAYRLAIQAIRDGLGPDVLTMGCGTPLLAGRGLFDAVRVGPDSVTDWKLLRDPLTNAALRQPLHRRWWWNDADNVVLRPPLTIDQARLWAAVVAMTGGNVFLGDDLRRLDEERWEIARRLWPPAEESGRPLGIEIPHIGEDRPLGDGWVAAVGQRRVVALLNGEDEPRERGVSWTALGLPTDQPCHVWELWSEAHRGVARGELHSTLPATSCEVLVLTPVRDHPQIIGSTRHIMVGAVGLDGVAWDKRAHTLRGRITDTLPGQTVRLTVAVPTPWRAAEAVGVSLEKSADADQCSLVTLRATADGPWSVRFENE